jgi:hypothetical protein
MDQLSNLFSCQVPDADFIQNLKENPGSFMLGVDHFNNMILLHQVSILGLSLFQPEQFILFLGGVPQQLVSASIHPVSVSQWKRHLAQLGEALKGQLIVLRC